MKILVTGSSGFLGSHICRQIELRGHEVLQADLPYVDITKDVIVNCIRNADAVIHCAAMADVYIAMYDREACSQINVMASERLALYCVKYGKPMYFVSTLCVYGNAADMLVPTENYAAGKVAAEYLIRGTECDWTIFRCPTMYGPGMRPSLFVYSALDSITQGRLVTVNGNGRQSRQYGYVEDTAANIAQAVIIGRGRGDIYDLPGSESISVNRVIAECERVSGKRAKVHCGTMRPWEIFEQRRRENLTGECLGMSDYCARPFSDGMDMLWDWYVAETGNAKCA